MPIYEYRCDECQVEFEKLVFGSDVVSCPKCGGEVHRMMSCCTFKSAAGDFKTSGTGKSGCSGCSATSCATCH
ncbi:FmdB family zinc ribbon protein [Desulfomonile tiedjei]|uniref:Putative regulatory protein, FmdB family n=1 Tax=Desulfomonile tiedjei (strain ATCC 49306 / DSM 6799 / DCB-1) TaxID=706587 RepID=I4CA36_DESTA|nr:zinc ribbon domain-containing protein [Desulfomonile tiedjei]AFM26427.1 putative regulatory protein, FmdB family [Desulfomonile tiedjei DSM 6799]